MRRWIGCGVVAVSTLIAGLAPCLAGPPFFTDDPEPVELGHNEFYVFGTIDRAATASAITGPAVEYNRGIAPDTQFHVVVPMAWSVPNNGTTTSGLGDTELGIKYRFVDGDDGALQMGVFPMVELATGSARRGLGNGHTWYRVPLWIQKSVGAWTFDGGGGFIINPAPDTYDASFGGTLAQFSFNPHLMLGVELFRQNALAADQPGYTLLNFGGYLNFSRSFSLLFSAGGSVAGARHAVAYLGLYWTWSSVRLGD